MSLAVELLLVTVHGFLGSVDSFDSFPDDLSAALNDRGLRTQVRPYPTFETAGNNHRAVLKFVDWLLLNATTLQAKAVVILAHSMGGLLASDAYRYLYEHELLDTTEPKAPPEGFFSRLFVSRSLASATAQENTADHSARHLVNITGLLAFDSPFFGLDPRIVTAGGPSRNVNRALAALPTPSVELLTSMLPETLSLPLGTDQGAPSLTLNTDWITAGATSVYKTLVPEGTTTPEQTEVVVVEEETVKETVGAAVQVTSGHVSTVSTSAEPTPESCLPTETAPTGPEIMSFSSNSATITATATESTTNIKTTSTMTTTTWNYVKYAAAGVGVAAAAVASIPLGLSFVPATLGSAWVVAKAEEARKHFEFLCPLATSTSEMEARIRAMNKAHDQGVAVFHCFYLEYPPIPTGKEVCSSDTPLEDIPKGIRRRFCQLPPDPLDKYFVRLSSFSLDEIEGHMFMFSKTHGSLYDGLIERVTGTILGHSQSRETR